MSPSPKKPRSTAASRGSGGRTAKKKSARARSARKATGATGGSSGGIGASILQATATLTRPRNLVLAFFLAAFSGAGIGMAMVYLPDPSSVRVLEEYRPSMQVALYDDQGNVFGELEAQQRRKLVAYRDIPEQLRNALLASEDSRFFWHVGVDPIGVLGAFRDNITQGFGERGASTITMQLARGMGWSSPEKTASRKLVEAFYYALQTERYFSKERILELYMNQVFMGHNAHGFGAAAEMYFGKELHELTLAESALLAGIVQRPNDYYPLDRNQERAFRRRALVLGRMVDEGYITEEEAEQARNEPLDLAQVDKSEVLGAYFTEEIRRILIEEHGGSLYESGMRVQTTLDPRIQAAAERALDARLRETDKTQGWRGVERNLLDEGVDLQAFELPRWDRPIAPGDYVPAVVLEASNERAVVRIGPFQGEVTPEGAAWTTYGRPDRVRLERLLRAGDLISVHVTAVNDDNTVAVELDQEPELDGAVLVVENLTGEIKAEVGGRRFDDSEFNRARQAVRQTGSAFKPFVYAAALAARHTAGDVVIDMPRAFEDEYTRQPYEPQNHGNEYTGITTYTEALARSRNVVAVDVQQNVGSTAVIEMARSLGITANLQPYLSLALGTVDVSLWEMTRAYAVFANGGVRVEPHRVRTVVDREGTPTFRAERQAQQVMDAAIAYQMVRMLNNVIEYTYTENGVLMGGSGRRALSLVRELGMPLAGKTGTTQEYSDAWFLGFSPYHTIGVWVGHDTKKPIGPGREGANTALPIWMDVMRAASEGLPPKEFDMPGGMVLRTVDARTGLLSSNVCGPSVVVAYIEGDDPTRVCGPEEARVLSMNYYQQAYFIERIREGR